MFLKNLTIKGFKSFADTASLDLEPGVTVVVGPNGSGKSNVVDAIAWVLGAQAPSAVRSQKMDDVIFAGTSKRSALGRAEVALTIDNSAGLLPIDFSEITITRTLFRTGDSEYQINGVPCRLLDIVELLSDSGVGKMQHVIISQGQIDAVLNAKPTERRLIIEEAAGVLKYRKRKEKAERRLQSTEANLTRVQDLLREVRRGLRPLEKQADAARRHGDLVAELSALRRFLAGRELAQLRTRFEHTARDRSGHARTEETLRARLAELDTSVLAAETELNAMGGADVGDELTRFEALRERGRGIAAVLAERQRSLVKERESSVDGALIASLEADQARLRDELAAIDVAANELVPEADEVARAERGLADARATFEDRWGEGIAAPSGEAAQVRGELSGLRQSVTRAGAELERTDGRNAALVDKRDRLEAEAARLRDDLAAAAEALPALEAERDRCLAARAEAEAALETAGDAHAEADAERRSWQARADALALALDQARADAGAERLAAIEGVVGTLLDVVDIDPGWEGAFEAAAAEALGAVVVDGPDAARAALGALSSGDGDTAAGAILALGVDRTARIAPPVGEPVRAHVRAISGPGQAGVDALLDAVVGAAVAVDGDWAAGLDVALLHPDAVVVTADGARFGPGAWRVGGTATGATGAALDEAVARAEAAAEAVSAAATARNAARSDLAEAKRSAGDARQQAEQTAAARRRAADGLERVERQAAEAAEELGAQGGVRAEVLTRIDAEKGRIAELEAMLPALEAEEAAAAEAARAMADARAALDERASAVGALRSDLEIRVAQIEERRTSLRSRLTEVEARVARNEEKAREAAIRRTELDARAATLGGLLATCESSLEAVEARLVVLREERQKQSEAQRSVSVALDGLRRERMGVEKELTEARERMQRADLELGELKVRIETAVETMRRDLDVDPDTAMATECPELPETTSPAARTRELERELRLMGPINPLALEEYEALQERHTFLQAQLDDVKGSRKELAKVIRAIDAEIVDVFAGAFADVSQNFTQLFSTLFPGGTGSITLTDPDDLLETGIEVEAKPSGKNVRKLSLLSGGERSLTALAFLFAVFRSRPSPFYVMDEVEAALDDVNLHRFLELVAEFRREAQLVIVSHQKRTMEAADVLYGVTMSPGGSSKVVSEKGAARHADVA